MINHLDAQSADFSQAFAQLQRRESFADVTLTDTVSKIITAIHTNGDHALLEYTNTFDNRELPSIAASEISQKQQRNAFEQLPNSQRQALSVAADRIRFYHEKQRQTSWQYTDDTGTTLGQKTSAIERAGVYVPGGKASYPSSVLMNVLPAKVAGVKHVTMVAPAPNEVIAPIVLAAAYIAQVDTLFTIGGAQAIAALAFGTQTIPKVDKIVGPGNAYVAEAKRQVFGKVGLDMIAGPSEVLIISDGSVDPKWLAMDLFAQAEHDEKAQCLLISPDTQHLHAVKQAMEQLLPTMPRQAIIAASLRDYGALITVQTMEQAFTLSNQIAPEHLELAIADAPQWLDNVEHAGAVFVGKHTAEALGDYCAGPNHVLPTFGTARFSSPLSVVDFQKRTSIIQCTPQSANVLGQVANVLAQAESLEAHARSAAYRCEKIND